MAVNVNVFQEVGTGMAEERVKSGLKALAFKRGEEAKEQSRGNFAWRVDAGIRLIERNAPDFFRHPDVSGFLNVVSDQLELGTNLTGADRKLGYLPGLVREAVEKRGVDYEQAYTESLLTGFVIRNKLLEKVSGRMTASSEGELDQMFVVHFILTKAEMVSGTSGVVNTRTVTPSERNDFTNLRSDLFGVLSCFGARHPDQLEEIYHRLGKMVDLRTRLYDNQQFAKNFSERLHADRAGLRSEVVTYLILERMLRQGKLAEGLVGSRVQARDLGIYRALPEFDRDGIMDWGVGGKVVFPGGGQETDLLVAVDVKTEGGNKVAGLATVGIASKYRLGEPGHFVLDVDGDQMKKMITSRSDRFVLETGIPVLALRVPGLSGWDLRNQQYSNQRLDLTRLYAPDHLSQNVRLSWQLIESALVKTLNRALQKYG